MKLPVSCLSVVLPAYNEASNLPMVINSLQEVLEKTGLIWEIVIVDDGSHDNTGPVLSKLKQDYPNIVICTHQINQGYGAALKTGLIASKGDLVLMMDADGQIEADPLLEILPVYTGNQFYLGYREHRQDKFHRKVFAWLWNRWIHLLFRVNVRDIDCAFKLFPRKAIDPDALKAKGALFSTELLVRLRNSGVEIRQIPIKHYSRKAGTSSGGNIKVIFKAFYETFSLYQELSARHD